MTTDGLLNYKNYAISIKRTMGIPIAVIAEALGQTFPVIDVTVENWKSPNRTNNINYGGIIVYVRCQSYKKRLTYQEKYKLASKRSGYGTQG